jgi:serine/threonine protein kinase
VEGSGAPLPHVVGRYLVYDEIASGGMATVHLGRLAGPGGFSRIVAIKRLHAQYAKDPDFVAMFLDEARMAACVRHPNVVPTLDVVARDGELFVVMDYVQGESLARLLRASTAARQPVPMDIVSSILCGVLSGLHAAHEATNDQGEPLAIVHRDVSPQNVLVGADGIARVLDFGVAKAAGQIHTTRDGHVKGKLAYMAPEQLRAGTADRRTDIFAVGILLWESLTLERLFGDDTEGRIVTNVLEREISRPGSKVAGLPSGLDEVTLRALARDPAKRFSCARDMAAALEACVPMASPSRVAAWVDGLARDVLARRAGILAQAESHSRSHVGVRSMAPDDPTTTDSQAAPPRSGDGASRAGLSQVSSISVSTNLKPHATGRRRMWVVVAVTAFASGTVGIAIAPRTAGLLPHGASATQEPLQASAEAPVVAVSPPSASAANSNVAAPATAPTSSPPPAPPVAPAEHPMPKVPVSSTKPCAIQSSIDSAGIKHFVKVCK